MFDDIDYVKFLVKSFLSIEQLLESFVFLIATATSLQSKLEPGTKTEIFLGLYCVGDDLLTTSIFWVFFIVFDFIKFVCHHNIFRVLSKVVIQEKHHTKSSRIDTSDVS